jgi:hypothetical protein
MEPIEHCGAIGRCGRALAAATAVALELTVVIRRHGPLTASIRAVFRRPRPDRAA